MKISKKISFLVVTFGMGISFLAGCNNNNATPQPSGGGEGEGGGEHVEPAHVHTYSALIPEDPATCTEAGKKAYYTCSGCDKLFDADKHEVTEAQLVIAALGHQMTPHAKVEAQCEAAGQEAYFECGRCHKLFSDEQGEHEIEAAQLISATGHQHLTAHQQVDPTCTEPGTEAYWSCDDCHKLFSDAQGEHEIAEPVAINALDHDYGTEWVQGEETHYHVCSRCGAKKDEAAHSADSWTVTTQPTYETEGVKTGTCVCGKVLTQPVPKKTAENVYNFASKGNPDRPGSPDDDPWNWGTTEGISVVNFGVEGYAFKFSMSADDAITEAFYQTLNQTTKIEEDKVVTLQVKNGTDKELQMTVKNRSWNVSGEQFVVAAGEVQQFTVGAVIYNRESDNPAQGIYAGFAIQFLATDSGAFVGDILITAPTEPAVCQHTSVKHVTGTPAHPLDDATGVVDHYECAHCGKIYADEAKTVELTAQQIVAPADFAITPNWSWNAIPVYDADHGILYKSPATFNDTNNPDADHYCAIETSAKEITDGLVKSITFKFMNGTDQKLTFEVRTRAWNNWIDTLQIEPGQWGQYTYTRALWNSDKSGENYGFALRILRDKTLGELPTGFIYNALPEYTRYSNEEIAAMDARLASVNVVDGIQDDTYLASFIASRAVIDDINKAFGDEAPESFENKAIYEQYLPFFQTNKLLFDGSQKVSRWGYGDASVTDIQSQVINGVPYNKLTLANASGLTEGFAVCTPRTDDSKLIQNADKFIIRIYNPANAKVSLRIHGGWDDWNAYVTDLVPQSWNTLIVDTAPFVKGDYFGLQFLNADADLSGEWLISSIAHYAFNSDYVWGFKSGHNMTVAPSWGHSAIKGYEDRAVYNPVMTEGTSTMTALENVKIVDAEKIDHIEFYVYNDTGTTITLSSYGDYGTGTNNNLGQVSAGEWTKVTMSVEIWNDVGPNPGNGAYVRYITYFADVAFSGNIYVSAFVAVGK